MDRYEVVVLRYWQPPRLKKWRDVPTEYAEAREPMRNLVLPLANAWAKAFNEAELKTPYGVWAIVRPQQKADEKPGQKGSPKRKRGIRSSR